MDNKESCVQPCTVLASAGLDVISPTIAFPWAQKDATSPTDLKG